MKDSLTRQIVKQLEMKKLVYKCLASELPKKYQALVMLVKWKQNNLPKRASAVQVRNRCALTNRSRGVNRQFRVSRICLRQLANAGFLPGVSKSSW
jgi:small subunit ribosomal protein S14